MITLLEAAPREFEQFEDTEAFKHKDVEVVATYNSCAGEKDFKPWPGKHKNVVKWWVLANGKAVGWNENVVVGWSFPVINYSPKGQN